MQENRLPLNHLHFTTLVCTILRTCEICPGRIGDFLRSSFLSAKTSRTKFMASKWTASGKVQVFMFSIILRKDRLASGQSQTCTQALEKPLEIVALLLLRAVRSFSKRTISK